MRSAMLLFEPQVSASADAQLLPAGLLLRLPGPGCSALLCFDRGHPKRPGMASRRMQGSRVHDLNI